MKYIKPKVTLLYSTPLYLVEIASRKCYDSLDRLNFKGDMSVFSEIDTNIPFIRQISINKGHSSVLEHSSVTFEITFQRNVLHELSRHRIGISPSVKSTRYTLKEMIKLYKAMNDTQTDYENFLNYLESNFGIYDKELTDNTIEYIIKEMDILHNSDMLTNDNLKNILPEHWLTSGIYTMNVRSLMNLFNLRLDRSAFLPFRFLAYEIYNSLPVEIDELFNGAYDRDITDIRGIMQYTTYDEENNDD